MDKWLLDSIGGKAASGAPGRSSEDHAGLDETITDFNKLLFQSKSDKSRSNTGGSSEKEEKNRKNLIRCTYLAQGGEDDICNYLLDLGFTQVKGIKTLNKLRALKCLLSVIDVNRMEEFTSKTMEELKAHMQALYFISRLETLNLSLFSGQDSDFFSSDPDKILLIIETLSRSCSHRPEGVALVVDLCLHYGIFQPASLWISLLVKMTRLGMAGQLRLALLELNHHEHLWHFPEFLAAWNFLLGHPFSRVTSLPPVSDLDRSSCAGAVALLESCPLASDLDVRLLWGECKRLHLHDLAEQLKSKIRE